MCTNDSNSGRGSKTSSPLCLPSNKRLRRDECALGIHQNTTGEYSSYIDAMIDTGIIEILRRKFIHLASELTERGRRRWAASEGLALGHGGIKVVAQATGLGERTIRRGCQEWRHEQTPASLAGRRIRHPGG